MITTLTIIKKTLSWWASALVWGCGVVTGARQRVALLFFPQNNRLGFYDHYKSSDLVSVARVWWELGKGLLCFSPSFQSQPRSHQHHYDYHHHSNYSNSSNRHNLLWFCIFIAQVGDRDQNLPSEEKYRQARQLYMKAKTFNIDGKTFSFQAENLEEYGAERREVEEEVISLSLFILHH